MSTCEQLIEERKRYIESHVKTLDNLLKLKGKNQLTYILNMIKSNEIDESFDLETELNKRVKLGFKTLDIQRKYKEYSRAKEQYDNHAPITLLDEYKSLCGTVFNISNDLDHNSLSLDNAYSIINRITNKYRLGEEDYYTIAFNHKDKLFIASTCYRKIPVVVGYENEYEPTRFEGERKTLEIVGGCGDKTSDFRIEIVLFKDSIEVAEECYMCNHSDCPKFAKIAINKIFSGYRSSDNSTVILCDKEDICKCDNFKNVLNPYNAIKIYALLLQAYDNRSYKKTSADYVREMLGEKVERTLTLPTTTSDKNVIIYVDRQCKLSNNNCALGTKHKSHASPREHERAGCEVHYASGKVGTRRGCTVNKGQTKTTYEVR